jgi:O-antigen/teichoic acid export membrane protein
MTYFSVAAEAAANIPTATMMGNYFTAVNFAVLLTFVSFPIATALFPIFSKLNPDSEPKLVKTVFTSSVKYTALILVPATLLMVTLATPLVNTLYPQGGIIHSFFNAGTTSKFPDAPLFLALSVLVNLFVLVGNISLGTFQTGIGKTKQVMWQSVLSLCLGLPLAILLVWYFFNLAGAVGQTASTLAVIGGVFGSLIASLPGMIWGLIWVWKNYGVKADFGNSARILASSALASVVTFVVTSFLSLPFVVLLAVGFLVFAAVYLTAAPLLGAISQIDIDNFRAMFSSLGFVSRIIEVPLLFMRRLCKKPENKMNNNIHELPS